jgi:hypothetical protein
MPVSALQIGLGPDGIDYGSPDHALLEGLARAGLRAANEDNLAAMRAAGYEVDHVDIDLGETAVGVVRQKLALRSYDAVLFGPGVRLAASNTLLFETLVNLVHAALPACRFVFNHGAPGDIRRWFPNPCDPTPVA